MPSREPLSSSSKQVAPGGRRALGAARCAELLAREVDCDFVDVNMGCPIDLVCKKGAGADEEARRLTESLPKETRAALDLGQGDVIEIVPFHPAATFGAAPRAEDEVGSGGYICTYLDTGDDDDDDDDDDSGIPDEAALRAMIAEHAAMRGGADTRADWIQSRGCFCRRTFMYCEM